MHELRDPTAPVLVADDGELDEVRRVLESLGIEYAEADTEAPRARVVVSNGRKSRVASPLAPGSRRFHVAVVDKLTRMQRRELERERVDFVFERPVDATALRLVLLHALYTGPERRRASRTAMELPVRFRAGLLARAATLVELSEGGCRLVTRRPLGVGRRVEILRSAEAIGAQRLELVGRVVGASRSGPDSHAHSIAFEPLTPTARASLRAVLARPAVGTLAPRAGEVVRPMVLDPEMGGPLPPEPEPSRRRAQRGTFERSVLATSEGAALVLLGRDLSVGGMRVCPDAALELGSELKLVIHGASQGPPLLLKAVVARDEGEEGLVLHFPSLTPELRGRIERLVASLPSVQPADAGASAAYLVVSEVLGEP